MKQILERHGGWMFVAVAALLVYANSLANGFALDDVFIIQLNTRVHELSNPSAIWLTPYWPYHGREFGLYRPFTIFAYAAEWAISGGAAWFFHFCNVALHVASSVLAFLLLRHLFGVAPAVIGGLVFAVHPVHTEAVANVVGQAELIAAAATFGAALIHATRPDGAAIGWGRRAAILALFAAGTLAKESAIVLPGLLVAVDAAQRRFAPRIDSMVAYTRAMAMPMFLIGAAAVLYLAVRVDVLGSLGGTHAAPSMPFLREDNRILTAFRAWPEYIRLLFFPADLSADYSPAVILPVERFAGLAMFGAVLLVLVAALALATPWVPAAGLAAAWFLISILPTSNLLVPTGIVVAERTLYTPSFAAAIVLAAAWAALVPSLDLRARRPRLALAAIVVIGLAMSGRTYVRNPDWKDLDAVWSGLIRDHPESYRAQWALASRSPRTEERLARLEFANKLWGYDPEMLSALAFEHLGFGRDSIAIPLLERSREVVPFIPRTHALLAYAYISAGRFEDALRSANAADRAGAEPRDIVPAFAQVYTGLGQPYRAIGAWQLAIKLMSGRAWPYWLRLAREYARIHDPEAALAAVDSAELEVPPGEEAAAADLAAKMREAIRNGCYDLAAEPKPGVEPDACPDPLAQWRLVMPLPVRENASSSQNATQPTTSAAPSEGGGKTPNSLQDK